MAARVIAVTGGKGGVGKSTTTINLGVSLRFDGHTVALVDTDIEMPNLVELLDVDPEFTVHDVLSGTVDTERALVELGAGFDVLAGESALSGYAATEPAKLETVVGTLEESYDYVLLDTGAGLSYEDVMPLGLASEIVLVTSPDGAAVENAKRTQAFVRTLNRSIEGIVVTKADGSVDGSIADEFDTELLAVVPDDKAVRSSTAAGEPLEVHAPNSPAAQAYRQLEANLTDGVLPPQRTDATPSSSPDTVVEAAGREGEQPDEPSAAEDEDVSEEESDEPPSPSLFSRIVERVTL